MANFATILQTLVKNEILGTATPSPTTVDAVELSSPKEDKTENPLKGRRGRSGALSPADSPLGVHHGATQAEPSPLEGEVGLIHMSSAMQKEFQQMLKPFSPTWN